MGADIVVTSMDKTLPVHRHDHPDYEYEKRPVTAPRDGRGVRVAFYQLPPGRSNYPYHYHTTIAEVFYIISGEGVLRMPEGERTVRAGDVAVFPPGDHGAHKLTNVGQSLLTYLDVDVDQPFDAAFYPDSDKVGLFGEGLGAVFRRDDAVNYYLGE